MLFVSAGGALLAAYSLQSCYSLQSPLSVFFLIALARQCVCLGMKNMMPIQNGLPRRATADVGAAVHGGYGADVGGRRGVVCQIGCVVEGDIAGGGGGTHSPPFEAVNIEHSVVVHGLPVQGAVGGDVPRPVDVMEAPEDGNAIRSLLGYPKKSTHNKTHIKRHCNHRQITCKISPISNIRK
jgi:hypothetical protein